MFFCDKLVGMGADITICDPHRVIVNGITQLKGQHLSSPDLRAGIALVIAALMADGFSIIDNASLIDRGYENIDNRLRRQTSKNPTENEHSLRGWILPLPKDRKLLLLPKMEQEKQVF